MRIYAPSSRPRTLICPEVIIRGRVVIATGRMAVPLGPAIVFAARDGADAVLEWGNLRRRLA